MRLRVILITVVVALTGVVAGCGSAGGGKPHSSQTVVAAFYPVAYAARELAPPAMRIVNLTPPGVEPHDLELSPKDVQKVRDADLVLLLGHGFQPEVEKAAGHGG